MEKTIELYVCTYGDVLGTEKGLVKVTYNKKRNKYTKEMFVCIDGKANMAVDAGNVIYISEQRKDGNFLVTYDKESKVKLKEVSCEYFYSWGCYKNEKLYLASFSSGVDSVYDCKKKKMIATYVHKDNTQRMGRSHYIKCLNDGIISVENALQKVYFYKNELLEVDTTLSFDEINVRLLSINPSKTYAYMNTEITNEVIVLDLCEKKEVNRIQLTKEEGFSGGNAINEDGSLLTVSVRGENKIYVLDVNDGDINFNSSFYCGNTPRDMKIKDNILFVTCTGDNNVEIYDLNTFKKLNTVSMCQPITFNME